MRKLIIISAVIMSAIWIFTNASLVNEKANNLKNQTLNTIQQEKTLKAIIGNRKDLKKATQDALNNN